MLKDLKSLFKLKVLIANVLPVLTGLWLVIQLNNLSFIDNIFSILAVSLGSLLVIAGALVLNNWYDYDIDSVMSRTEDRPTVTGNMTRTTVLNVGIITSFIGFILLFFINWEVVIWAFVGWFTYVVPYTMWSKRKYTWNTIIGSVSGAVTPMIGWAAFESSWDIVPITFFLILFFWQMPHTYFIAIRRFDDYKTADVKMLPVVKGFDVTKKMIVFYVICLLPLPFLLWELGTFYVVFVFLMTIAWLIIVWRGFKAKDTFHWANVNFFISVNYLMIIFVLAMIVTI